MKSFNIPAQALSEALIQFGRQSGLQVTTDSRLMNGKLASAVSGTMPAKQALMQLLSGTGLSYRINGKMINLVDNVNAITLPSVKIGANVVNESAHGPVIGYVAKRSATATKTSTPIIETPQSISVVTRNEMDARNIRDTGEAVAYTAGVVANLRGETSLFGGNSIRVRGFGGGGTSGISLNEYLDGMKLNAVAYVSANLDPYLFERVEVLKGPASVLFGQTQPGGIVNMVSKRPNADSDNQIRVSSGNRDELDLAFDLNGALSDNVLFRVVGVGLTGNTQQKHSDRERQMLAPSLSWSNNSTSLTILSNYQKDDINATVLSTIPRNGVFSNPNGDVPQDFRVGDPGFEDWDRQTWSLGYLFSHQFSDTATFRQNLRYTDNELDSRWIFRDALLDDNRTLTRRAMLAQEEAQNVTFDNQLELNFSMGNVKHTLLTGVDYQRFTGISWFRLNAAPPIDLFNPIYYQDIPIPTRQFRDRKDTVKQLGVYLQDQIKIGSLSLLIGGRYDDAENSTRDQRDPDSETLTEDNSDFTGRVGLIYNFANGFAPYASYSESFEPVSGTAADGSRFEPTKGLQYEVGIKYQPTDGNHLITLAAFDLTQENLTTGDPNNPGERIQTGEISTQGVELEGKANLAAGLDLTLAYTYLADEVSESNESNVGKRRAEIPRHSASVWVNYALLSGALQGLELGLGVRHVGKTQGNANNEFTVSDFTLVDLAVNYNLENSPLNLQGWRASVNVNNALDEQYISSCSADRSCFLGLNRTIRASLWYNW